MSSLLENRRITRSMSYQMANQQAPQFEYWIIKDDYSEPTHILRDTKLSLKELQAVVGGNIEIQSLSNMQCYLQTRIGINMGPVPIPDKFKNMHWVVMNENPSQKKLDFANETMYTNFTCEVVGNAIVAAKNCFDM